MKHFGHIFAFDAPIICKLIVLCVPFVDYLKQLKQYMLVNVFPTQLVKPWSHISVLGYN